jgi:hypothetical protein
MELTDPMFGRTGREQIQFLSRGGMGQHPEYARENK